VEPYQEGPLNRLPPGEVSVSTLGVCSGTLGSFELEAAAALVVVHHWMNGLGDWSSVTPADLFECWKHNEHMKAASQNPFWRPAIGRLREDGWVTGWDTPASAGTISERFILAVSNPSVNGQLGYLARERHIKELSVAKHSPR